MSDAAFPQPLPTDPEDVAWALSTGQAMWNRGERAEAIKWIKRASDSAADASDDDRAFALARAAAELKSQIGSVMPPPAPEAPPPQAVPPAPPAPAATPAPPATGARGTMVMSAAQNPAAARPSPGPQRPVAPSVAPTAGNPAPTAGAPAGAGFRPRAPGSPGAPGASPAPTAGARPGPASPASPIRPVAPVAPAGRLVPPPTPDVEHSEPPPPAATPAPAPVAQAKGGARAFEIPPKLRSPQPPEQSNTAITPFQPAGNENDPDDWPTNAFSGDELPELENIPPQLINENQSTVAASFHTPTPAHLYLPGNPSPAAGQPAQPAAQPAVPAAQPSPGPGRSPSVAPAAGGALVTFRVWISSTPQGPVLAPITRPRPEGAVEAVIVAPAGPVSGWLS